MPVLLITCSGSLSGHSGVASSDLVSHTVDDAASWRVEITAGRVL